MEKKTIIAGIGNRLLSDDGFGPRVIDLLTQMDLPEEIELRDMGTAGLTIASDLSDYTRAIFLDTMEMDAAPGKLHVSRLKVDGTQENVIDLSRTTLHDAGLEGLLKFAKAINVLPEEVYLIGCKPKSLEVGLELSNEVEKATHAAVKKVLGLLEKD